MRPSSFWESGWRGTIPRTCSRWGTSWTSSRGFRVVGPVIGLVFWRSQTRSDPRTCKQCVHWLKMCSVSWSLNLKKKCWGGGLKSDSSYPTKKSISAAHFINIKINIKWSCCDAYNVHNKANLEASVTCKCISSSFHRGVLIILCLIVYNSDKSILH